VFAVLSLSAAAVLTLAATQQQFPTTPTAQHPVFRAGATLVAVDVYPTKDGKVVEGLKPSDFDVKEDGKPQAVEFFEFLKFEASPADSTRIDPATAEDGERLAADPHHRAFVAYFDTYHLTTWGARQMRVPVIDFLDRTIGPTDYFAAMNPEVPASDLTFGQRTETVTAEVERYWPLAAVVDTRTAPMSPHEQFLQACYQNRSDFSEVDVILREAYRRSRLDVVLKNLVSLVAKLATVREERTNVLLFSDGWALDGPDPTLEVALWHDPFTPKLSGGQLVPNPLSPTTGAPRNAQTCDAELGRLAELDFHDDFRRLTDDGLRKNIAFYPIEPAGLEAFGDDLTTANPSSWSRVNDSLGSLMSLAASTNGIPIVRTNSIGTPLRQLSTALSSYYLLGYYTTNATLDGKYRTIQVKVNVTGAKVTNRHGYIASPNPIVTTTTTSVAAVVTPEKSTLATLASLDGAGALFVAGVPSRSELTVVAEVGTRQTSAIANGADVAVTVTGAAGATPLTASGHIDKGATSALVRLPIASLAGPWQVRVVVGSPADDLSASASIAAPSAALVGEPILYRATPSPRSPLWPSASHRFTRNDRLHLEWTMSGPLDSHIGRLLDSRGQPLAVGVSLTEPPNAPRPTLAADVSLAPLGPGDYLVELVVGKGGMTERHLVAIRIGT
jgi:VWFA-related protein